MRIRTVILEDNQRKNAGKVFPITILKDIQRKKTKKVKNNRSKSEKNSKESLCYKTPLNPLDCKYDRFANFGIIWGYSDSSRNCGPPFGNPAHAIP